MNVGKYLEQLGDKTLRDAPAGVIIANLVEIALQDNVDGSATGTSTLERIASLSDDAKSRLLNKEFPAGLFGLTSWGPAPPAARGGFIGMLLVTVLILVDCFISGIIGWKYFVGGIVPTEDMVMIVLGVPIVGICIYYGVGTDKLLQALLDIGTKRRSKEQ